MELHDRSNRGINPRPVSSGFFLTGLTALARNLTVDGQCVNLGDQRKITIR
jgi:hypothetical protein